MQSGQDGVQTSSNTSDGPGRPRKRRKPSKITRHPAEAAKTLAARQADQSPACANRLGTPFRRDFARFNDPVLPVENFDRCMEIINNLYTVYDHGQGQFTDQRSRKLICSFAFENLETMDSTTRREHQADVNTILLATDLFQRLPLKTPQAKSKDQPPTQPTLEEMCSDQVPQPHCPSHSDSPHPTIHSVYPKATGTSNVADQQTTNKTSLTTNGALIHGEMYCIGARAGYARDVLYCPYLPILGSSLSLYQLFLSELPQLGEHFGSRYETFTDHAFLESHELLEHLNLPNFTSTSQDERRTPHGFAGNFAFTFHNFWNKPHTDNDKGKVYCVWYPINSASGDIVSRVEGFELEGGWFIFPEWRIAFNFGTTSVAQISWSGKSSFHHTLPSKEKDTVGPKGERIHYTRLGCSSQITSSLARAGAKEGTPQQYNQASHCERDVLDCRDIIKLPRRWTK